MNFKERKWRGEIVAYTVHTIGRIYIILPFNTAKSYQYQNVEMGMDRGFKIKQKKVEVMFGKYTTRERKVLHTISPFYDL